MKKLCILFFLIGVVLTVQSQTLESLMNQGSSLLEELDESSAETMNRLTTEFIDFVEKNDKAFAEKLKKEWKPYKPLLGEKPPTIPGPARVPVYIPDMKPKVAEVISAPINVVKPVPVPAVTPIVRNTKEKEENDEPKNLQQFSFPFFNIDLALNADAVFKSMSFSNVTPKELSQVWEKMSELPYVTVVEQLNAYKTQYGLNDWGFYLLCEKFAKTLYGEKDKTLMHWFLLVRAGYDAKLAYSDNQFMIMIPALQKLYGRDFIKIDGVNYYLMSTVTKSVKTIDESYPGASRYFDFNFTKSICLPEKIDQRVLSFDYQGVNYEMMIDYDKAWIEYFKEYPLTEMDVYFNASVSSAFKNSILLQLKPLVDNMDTDEALGFLLALTQSSFDYKTDRDQFGREKFFFVEESLFYPYCDCEDRSVFYSYLVDVLIGKKVIGIEYPGHMATAVEADENTKGRLVEFENKQYVIADPTFVGAPIGAEMPSVKNSSIKIYPLMNRATSSSLKSTLWDLAEKSGALKGGGERDFIWDDNKAYITGYFIGKAFEGEHQLTGKADQREGFLACMNTNGDLLWTREADTKGSSIGLNLRKQNEMIFWNGSHLVSKEENKTESKLFVACYRTNGILEWMTSSPIKTDDEYEKITYMLTADINGSDVYVEYFNEDNALNNYDFWVDKEKVVLTGAVNKTTGVINARSTDYSGSYSISEDLKKLSEELVKKNYEKQIAGLFAVMELMENNGSMIKGKDVKAALDKYNPTFKKKSPNIYESITKINFLKNSQGVVTILTEDGKSTTIEKVRLYDNARIQLITLENGNGMWKVLSGIKVGKAVVWFKLNHVELYPTTGDMMFDYDDDHNRVKMNLEKDILY